MIQPAMLEMTRKTSSPRVQTRAGTRELFSLSAPESQGLQLNLTSTGIQASLEKCPWLVGQMIQLTGKREGDRKPNKGNQPEQRTGLFFDLYFSGFHDTHDCLVFLEPQTHFLSWTPWTPLPW